MSVRSFHSVFMASAVAGAALGCYLVSLRVASERAALEDVEASIVHTQGEIRLLQTEVGTRSRLTQLERWNARALDLSAPGASQILSDKFQLASLVRPEAKPAVEAPVVLASAPAPAPDQPLAQNSDSDTTAADGTELLHEASLKVEQRNTAAPKAAPAVTTKKVDATAADQKRPAKKAAVAAADQKQAAKKDGEKPADKHSAPVTKPVRTAKVDPLAPLPVGSATKGSRTNR